MMSALMSALMVTTAVSSLHEPVRPIVNQTVYDQSSCIDCHFDCSVSGVDNNESLFPVTPTCSVRCKMRSSSSEDNDCSNYYLINNATRDTLGSMRVPVDIVDTHMPWTIVKVQEAVDQEFELECAAIGCRVQVLWINTRIAGATRHRNDQESMNKAQLIDEISKSNYEKYLKDISGDQSFEWEGSPRIIKTRYTGTDGYTHAVEYFVAECVKLGYDVTTQEFPVRTSLSANVICTKVGSRPSKDGMIVVGGHLDSTSQSPTTLAPGACDNGSGSMAVLEILRAAAKLTFSETIQFVAFGGEEQGLYGSKHYVEEAQRSGVAIKSALVYDMISYSNRFYGVTLECDRSEGCAKLMETAKPNFAKFSSKLEVETTTISFGSDHVPFQQAGIPCFLAIQLDDTNYPHYHRTTDTVDYQNFDQAIDIIKGIAGTLADEALLIS